MHRAGQDEVELLGADLTHALPSAPGFLAVEGGGERGCCECREGREACGPHRTATQPERTVPPLSDSAVTRTALSPPVGRTIHETVCDEEAAAWRMVLDPAR